MKLPAQGWNDPQQLDAWHMARAIEVARMGEGRVEPNPMVGCVIAHGAEAVGVGWHRRFGGPHAEIEALRLAGAKASGATMYVTLEPCSHHGKTPPCAPAVIGAGVGRVVVAMRDPFPQVAGRGIEELRKAGLAVEVGVLEAEARRLNAPYLKLIERKRPWVIAKWAMTLDGKIATRTGSSQWISNEASRAVVHALRGRVDAVIVGRGTAVKDDPLLTARPPGPRTPTRIVLDGLASLSIDSRLVKSADEAPVLIAASDDAPQENVRALTAAGCEVFSCGAGAPAERLGRLLDELGRRRMTNVLVEGGPQLLGGLLDLGEIDEAHVFVGPKLVGGAGSPSAIAGHGAPQMSEALTFEQFEWRSLEGDLYGWGRVAKQRHAAG